MMNWVSLHVFKGCLSFKALKVGGNVPAAEQQCKYVKTQNGFEQLETNPKQRTSSLKDLKWKKSSARRLSVKTVYFGCTFPLYNTESTYHW